MRKLLTDKLPDLAISDVQLADEPEGLRFVDQYVRAGDGQGQAGAFAGVRRQTGPQHAEVYRAEDH